LAEKVLKIQKDLSNGEQIIKFEMKSKWFLLYCSILNKSTKMGRNKLGF
jgi:hypothetical protein